MTLNIGWLEQHPRSGVWLGEFEMAYQMHSSVAFGAEKTSGGKNGSRRDTRDSHT
jgi:hypothetical protein